MKLVLSEHEYFTAHRALTDAARKQGHALPDMADILAPVHGSFTHDDRGVTIEVPTRYVIAAIKIVSKVHGIVAALVSQFEAAVDVAKLALKSTERDWLDALAGQDHDESR